MHILGRMSNRAYLLAGFTLGAAVMYLLDPDRGRRRRAMIRDQVVHGAHEAEGLGSGMAARARHLRNRARGLAHEARTRLRRAEVDDAVVEARVRAHLGRLPGYAGRIAASAEHGRVTLRGVASEAEAAALVDQVQEIPGVHDVINRIQSRENAG